jgi:hypothetical protein
MDVFSIVVESVHMAELKKTDPRHVDKRHKEEFVSWFERKVSHS